MPEIKKFQGGNDKQRNHVNELVDEINKLRKEVDALKSTGKKIKVKAIQNALLVTLEIIGKKVSS